jgi:hypothetical protein
LNRFAKNKKGDQSNISIETLYDYFKNLNTNIDNDNNNIDIDINILPADLPFFNFCTTDFISSAVMGEFKISSISGERLSILISISILHVIAVRNKRLISQSKKTLQSF